MLSERQGMRNTYYEKKKRLWWYETPVYNDLNKSTIKIL